MTIIIINDCRDSNARGRQQARATALFGAVPVFIEVSHELEASGNLIDVLDALGEEKGIVLVNVAPRDHKGKKWENGTPFGYFYIGNVLVVSTVDGMTLSLVKKLKLADTVCVLDTAVSVEAIITAGLVKRELKKGITESQFRSFDFLPHIAAHLLKKGDLVSTLSPIENIPDAPHSVWHIDNFGNCKTTFFSEDVGFMPRNEVRTRFGMLRCYTHLCDVPDGHPALIVGSSGFKEKRFLEIVIQGSNAAKHFGIVQGDLVL